MALLIFASTSALSSELELNQLRYITEHSPPFNYVEAGQLKGPAVDLLLLASQKAGSPVARKDILLQPWARAYRNALEGPNTVLFNTIRTDARDKLFKWAGPTGSEKYVLIAEKARNIVIRTRADLTQYRLGAVRDDAGESYLRELHIPSKNITLATNVNNLGKMLKAGRIDMWAFGEDGWRQSLEDSAIKPANYEAVYMLKKNDYYFAFSLDVEDRLVQQMQDAIDMVKREQAKKSFTN
ncbi:transporter substrate-binding domain-containing protein [Simiduia curdlanivorans]|uniref:Substrate-binding periplasmic protein n=1 Tax=Simiduia curdlanivorans TaxID=1492769 RepID=A0ABV8V6F6_9GAMM|nr:transporter substrate-binding domain-containing protein [Simiduia curdlanivorans]MDN3640743.1 transporter substrate-binding domain-containing protein [Simiduia curdlanivorans]